MTMLAPRMSGLMHPGHSYGLGAIAARTPPNPLTQMRPQTAPATAAGIQQAAQNQAHQHGAPVEQGVVQGAAPNIHSPGTIPPGQKVASGLNKLMKMSVKAPKPEIPRPVGPAPIKPSRPPRNTKKAQAPTKLGGMFDTPSLDAQLAAPGMSVASVMPTEPQHPALGDQTVPPIVSPPPSDAGEQPLGATGVQPGIAVQQSLEPQPTSPVPTQNAQDAGQEMVPQAPAMSPNMPQDASSSPEALSVLDSAHMADNPDMMEVAAALRIRANAKHPLRFLAKSAELLTATDSPPAEMRVRKEPFHPDVDAAWDVRRYARHSPEHHLKQAIGPDWGQLVSGPVNWAKDVYRGLTDQNPMHGPGFKEPSFTGLYNHFAHGNARLDDPVEHGALWKPENLPHTFGTGLQNLAHNALPAMQAAPNWAKWLVPQGVKDWVKTDPDAALRNGQPSPPPDPTYLGVAGTMAGLKLPAIAQNPVGRVGLGALGGYAGGSGVGQGIDEFGQKTKLYNTHGLGRDMGGPVGAVLGGYMNGPTIAKAIGAAPGLGFLARHPAAAAIADTAGAAGGGGVGELAGSMVNYGRAVAQPYANAAMNTAMNAGMAVHNMGNRISNMAQVGDQLSQMKPEDVKAAATMIHQLNGTPEEQAQLASKFFESPGLAQGIKTGISNFVQNNETAKYYWDKAQGLLQMGQHGLEQLGHFSDQILGTFLPAETVAGMHPWAKAALLLGGLSAVLGFATGHEVMGGIGSLAALGGLAPIIMNAIHPMAGNVNAQAMPNAGRPLAAQQTRLSPADEAAMEAGKLSVASVRQLAKRADNLTMKPASPAPNVGGSIPAAFAASAMPKPPAPTLAGMAKPPQPGGTIPSPPALNPHGVQPGGIAQLAKPAAVGPAGPSLNPPKPPMPAPALGGNGFSISRLPRC